jgi:hypothetical protein
LVSATTGLRRPPGPLELEGVVEEVEGAADDDRESPGAGVDFLEQHPGGRPGDEERDETGGRKDQNGGESNSDDAIVGQLRLHAPPVGGRTRHRHECQDGQERARGKLDPSGASALLPEHIEVV